MQWDPNTMKWVPASSVNAPAAPDVGSSDAAKPTQPVTEETVLRIWEHASRRHMSPEERQRANGHALVAHLRRFSESDLSAAATSATRRGGDLDWREWRRAVERLGKSADPAESPSASVPPAAKTTKRRKRQGAKTRKLKSGRQQKSASRFTNPDDTRGIQTGAWKGRSPRAISDAELMKRLKKKYPNS